MLCLFLNVRLSVGPLSSFSRSRVSKCYCSAHRAVISYSNVQICQTTLEGSDKFRGNRCVPIRKK